MPKTLLLALAFVAAAACGSSPTVSVPAAPDKSAAPAAAKATPAPTPQVLLDLQGTGTKQTQKFTARSDWDLNWTYDCTSFGFQGNFVVEVMNGDGTPSLENQAVNQVGKKGADVQHYHKGGTFYLAIDSECDWTVHATG